MNMKFKLTCLIALISFSNLFGTAQVPDILIYNGDTLALYSNPLEDFFNESNPRPQVIVKSGCHSTACWRGYQAVWLIENNQLFLVSIRSCCMWRDYSLSSKVLDSLEAVIPKEIINKLRPTTTKVTSQGIRTEYTEYDLDRFLKDKLGKKNFAAYEDLIKRYSIQKPRVADLNLLFKDRVVNGKVSAEWYSGMLRVPKGKILDYVHMGYMSTYQYELTFEVEKGMVIESKEFSNEGVEHRIKDTYGVLTATAYSMAVPKIFLDGEEYEYAKSDTIDYVSDDGVMKLHCESMFNSKRLSPELRRSKVDTDLDSLINRLSEFKFEPIIHDLSRWGTVGWVDGRNSDAKEFIRIYTVININGQMIFFFRSKASYEAFYETAQSISNTVRLMEFGY